jgi:demethoxyubiquinone hydroxylase (CLK1/Coq7/Cat5 family)
MLEPVLPVNDWKIHVKKQKQKWSVGRMPRSSGPTATVIRAKQVSEILAQKIYAGNAKVENKVEKLTLN